MLTTANRIFELPDTIAALPRTAVRIQRGRGWDEARAILSAGPDELFRRLLRDQESEAVLLAARRVSTRSCGEARGRRPGRALRWASRRMPTPSPAQVAAARGDAGRDHPRPRGPGAGRARGWSPGSAHRSALLGGCWLDVLSPAGHPALDNRQPPLRAALRTARRGATSAAVAGLRRGAARMEEARESTCRRSARRTSCARAEARPLTALHGCFYLALSRLPANFLPELVGVHYAVARARRGRPAATAPRRCWRSRTLRGGAGRLPGAGRAGRAAAAARCDPADAGPGARARRAAGRAGRLAFRTCRWSQRSPRSSPGTRRSRAGQHRRRAGRRPAAGRNLQRSRAGPRGVPRGVARGAAAAPDARRKLPVHQGHRSSAARCSASSTSARPRHSQAWVGHCAGGRAAGDRDLGEHGRRRAGRRLAAAIARSAPADVVIAEARPGR